MKKSLFLLLAFLMTLIIALPICSATEKVSDDSIRVENLQVISTPEGTSFLEGKLVNVSNRFIESAYIHCVFFDSKGVQLTDGCAVVNELAAGKTAVLKFSPDLLEGTARYELTSKEVYAK